MGADTFPSSHEQGYGYHSSHRASTSPARAGHGYSTRVPLLTRSMSPMSSHLSLNMGGSRALAPDGRRRRSASPLGSPSSDSEDELTGAVGQLSLNEDEQVRYHGKASGLHLLGIKDRVDGRNEGGIW